MGVVVQVHESDRPARIIWSWEPETDILAGGIDPAPEGPAESLELNGHDGSVIVLDLVGGALSGLDVVVWPEVTTVAGLMPPAATRQGRIALDMAGATSLREVDVTLAARACTDESVIHVRVGAPRPTRVIQVADRLAVEVDPAGGLAGFWLTGVPPLTSGEDPA